MISKIRDYMAKKHMVQPGDSLLVGVSGGADSVCLLLVLKKLQDEMDFSLQAVHVEHGIRGTESREDMQFVERLCESMQVPLRVFQVDAPAEAVRAHLSLEEAARNLRYRCFAEAIRDIGGNKIAVAHHADDCAETMLFHMARGTGIRGLGGILPDRTWKLPAEVATDPVPEVHLIRPLLCVERKEIEEFLRECGQTFCVDRTNQDTEYARNRIRHQILPQLRQVNTEAVSHMAKSAESLAEISAYLERQTKEAAAECVLPIRRKSGQCGILIQAAPFQTLDPVIKKMLVHGQLENVAGRRRDLTAEHIGSVLRLFELQVGRQCDLPYRMKAVRTYDGVEICRGEEQKEEVFSSAELLTNGQVTEIPGWHITASILKNAEFSSQIPEKTYTKWFDYDKIKNAVSVRTRRTGDYLQVNGAGGTKKLKDYMINEKIPHDLRDQLPLLADGDHVLWVIGYRISEAYKVTASTKRVLCVQAEKGE